MAKSRREFLAETSLGLVGAAAVTGIAQAAPPAQSGSAAQGASPTQKPGETPPGEPPAFGTAAAAGPAVTTETFVEAEKLVQVTLSERERTMAAESWRSNIAPLYERRVGPRKLGLESSLAPATRWNPVLGGQTAGPRQDRFVRSANGAEPLPSKDEDIAFATLPQLSRWIQARRLTSERLTNIYLDRMARFNPILRCVITPTRELALMQARRADAEIAAGKYRGPLHGIPWGAKDLLDTAGIPTTYGAEPYRNRIPTKDAVVVQRLEEAGAVLVAKLSLGALALNDIWYGG